MKKMDIDSDETKDFFINAFKNRDLIPILGAGFSCKMDARAKNKVPSGKELKEDMINVIIKEKNGFTADSLRKKDFSWVAERFLKCDLEKISDYFYQHFTGIKFSGNEKKRFLNEIDWPYVYTLNIDTAIENSNEKWEVFYPNEDFIDKAVFNKKKLYKIHGDVNLFCKTKDVDKLILSQNQYLKSLRTNSLFHDKLSSDCSGHNLLYIGCSLDDEIDIKYTVISDDERNIDTTSARRIYVTFDDIEGDCIKIEDLESFRITNYIKLDNEDDYKMFYEFLFSCFKESQKNMGNSYDCYSVQNVKTLDNDRDKNLDYLLNLNIKQHLCKPYYFFNKSNFLISNLSSEKINVFVGRRFSGKTLFAYEILDKFKDRKRFFISSNVTISDKNIVNILSERNSLIIMDSNSISDEQLSLVCSTFDKDKNNIVCMMVNTFDEIENNISYFENVLEINPLRFNGRILPEECKQINTKLGEMGILIFNEKQTILDNTLRIGNELNMDRLSLYTIDNNKELELLIWLAVNKKIYLEQIMTLSMYHDFNNIVKKFSPILEIERNNRAEGYEHSPIKIICNAPIALLQILNNYAYPPKTRMGTVSKKEHFKNISAAIYHILFVFDKKKQDEVKKFLLFDILNDVFSVQYMRENIKNLSKDNTELEVLTSGKSGAAALIQAIYEDENIQKLKSSEPNYWLQRAKSLYILNSGKYGRKEQLEAGIEWAKKAACDSKIFISQGQNKYVRTLSNANMQIAMLYGKLAYKNFYNDISINTQAVHYYYESLSDPNNSAAAKSLMERSKGTRDFKKLLDEIAKNKELISKNVLKEAKYLCRMPEYYNGFNYKM